MVEDGKGYIIKSNIHQNIILTRLYLTADVLLLRRRLRELRRSGEKANIPRQATTNVTDNIAVNMAAKRTIYLLILINISINLKIIPYKNHN